MSGNKYMLDTNTVLYVLKGDEVLANFLYQESLFISVITEIELLSYKHITTSEENQIRSFISEFEIIGIDDAIKEKSIRVRKSYGLKLPDTLIVASALHLDLPLVTSDKQFKQIKELELIYNEK